MKAFLQKVVNYYNTNAKFHSFVLAIETGLSSGVAMVVAGGVPTGKAALYAAGFAIGGAVWGAVKRWAAQNIATVGVQVKNG